MLSSLFRLLVGLVISIGGGWLATNYDHSLLNLKATQDVYIVRGIYSLGILAIFIILVFLYSIGKAVSSRRKNNAISEMPTYSVRKIIISESYEFINPKENSEEYLFTVVNESGIDLKECYVELDDRSSRFNYQEVWELDISKLIDKTFRWNKRETKKTDRLDIDNNDRASFSLGELFWFSAAVVETGSQEWVFNFILSSISDEKNRQVDLAVDIYHKLLLTLHSKDEAGRDLPKISYSLVIRPTNSHGNMGGVEVISLEGVNPFKHL